MRYHDQQQKHDDKSTEHKPEHTLDADEPRKRGHAEESEEA